MSYLHSKNIVHADLKGVNIYQLRSIIINLLNYFSQANVLVDDKHYALVTDFGLSTVIDGIRSRTGHSTQVGGSRGGTLRWMAPECLDGDPATLASDVYSLGMTIWEVSAWLFGFVDDVLNSVGWMQVFSGEIPFTTIADRLLPRYIVDKGRRPDRPPLLESNDGIWDLIEQCWAPATGARPPISEVGMLIGRYTTRLGSKKCRPLFKRMKWL